MRVGSQLEQAEKRVGTAQCPMCEGRDLEVGLGGYSNDNASAEPIAHCRSCNYRWLEEQQTRTEHRPSALDRRRIDTAMSAKRNARNGNLSGWDLFVAAHPKTLIDGVMAGLVGGITVAMWFFITDLMAGRDLATPSLLGSVLLRGTYSASDVAVVPRFVIVYSTFHFCAFILFGVAAALLIEAADRQPAMLSAVILLFACFEFFFLSLVGIVSATALAELIWWRILAANVLASIAMISFFLVRHPALRTHLTVRLRNSPVRRGMPLLDK